MNPRKEPKQIQKSIRVEDSTVRTFQITPEIMEDLRASLIHTIKTDSQLKKDLIFELLGKNEVLIPKQTTNDEEVFLKEVNKDEAKKQIQEFVQSNPGCRTSDIIFALKLDIDLVMETLKELKNEELVEGRDVEQ